MAKRRTNSKALHRKPMLHNTNPN